MPKRSKSTYTADFETTSNLNYLKDGYVRVWLWSLVNIEGQEYYGTTIDSFLDKVKELKCDKIYFHNLRFDGYFIIYRLEELGKIYGVDYEVSIDNLGHWFQIIIAIGGRYAVKIWDSLKKFPDQSVNDVAKLYGIEGKKEAPFWDRYLPIDYNPTKEEIEYCLQDSRIIAYAIKQEISKGHTAMTLSADAFNNVKAELGGYSKWRVTFPELSLLDDEFIRKAYKGGWVYVNPKYQNKELDNITVYDVNSLYPYVMHDCYLPIGKPYYRTPTTGDLFVVQFETQFKIKKDKLPTVQIKGNVMYKSTEYIKESIGEVTLTMTNIDYQLFHDHYNIDYELNPRYICFKGMTGGLANYIDGYMSIKERATIEHNESERFLAKRYMNSPYGKTGMKPNRISRVPYMDTDEIIKFNDVQTESESIYVPYATFVCAYARNLIIRAAQQEFKNFVYADTDSLHLLGADHPEIKVHPTKLGYFKNEGFFPKGKYLRAKTYIHADENYKIIEIKCAGMPDLVKYGNKDKKINPVTWEDFRIGNTFKGKIMQKHVKGGCLLVDTEYRIRG